MKNLIAQRQIHSETWWKCLNWRIEMLNRLYQQREPASKSIEDQVTAVKAPRIEQLNLKILPADLIAEELPS